MYTNGQKKILIQHTLSSQFCTWTLDDSTAVLQRLASVAVTGLLCWWSPGVVGVVAVAVEAESLPVDSAHTVTSVAL